MNPEHGLTESSSNDASLTTTSISEEIADDASPFDIDQLITDVEKRGVRLSHERQHFNWDCGIACLRMVLKHFEKNQSGELMEYFAKMGLRTSIWTIDLAYLLHHFKIASRMSTITLGVDENYAGVDFYASHLSRDNSRVNQLFRDSHLNGVKVIEETIHMDTILDFLESKQMIIILIDWKKMGCLHCSTRRQLFSDNLKKLREYGDQKEIDQKGDKKRSNRDYQGHYICLTGVDRERNLIYFCNPSAKHPICVSAVDDVERARKSYGTDEDIIFIYDDRTQTSQI